MQVITSASAMLIRCTSVVVLLAGGPVALAQTSFQGLGDLPNHRGSYGRAMSADGAVVGGFSYDSNAAPHAFRWTQATGMTAVFDAGLDFESSALGISADGVTLGGWHDPTIVDTKAFTWDLANGEQPLSTRGSVQAVTSTVQAGSVTPKHGNPRASIWTGTTQTYIDGPGEIPTSDARALSADGTVVVGQALFGSAPFTNFKAFRWTAQGGMQNIGSDVPDGPASHADAITPDGSIVAGAAHPPIGNGLQAATWTAATGWTFLGTLPGATDSAAFGISADGSSVVGTSGGRAFLWRASTGMLDLQSVLSPPPGWTLTEARVISADGSIVMGTGMLAGVGSQAWIGTLGCSVAVPDVGNTLAISGAANSSIQWNGGGGPFNLYRGTATRPWSYDETCFSPNAPNPSFDATAPSAGTYYFYLVSRKDLCGHESVLGRDSAGAAIPSAGSCP